MGMLGTLWVTAKRLWFTVPRWRWLTIAAIVCSGGSLLSGFVGAKVTPPTSSASSNQPPVQSGGQASRQQPPGRVSPGKPIDHQAQLRNESFYKAYKASEADSAGARCDTRVAALSRLAAGDEATASSAQKDAIRDTRDNCLDPIKQSDARIRAAVTAWDGYKAGPTIGKARETIEREARLTDFDRERNLRSKGLAIGEIDDLRRTVSRYDSIMDRALTTESLYRPGDPATLDSAVSLATSWAELGKLPFPVMTAGMPAREVKAIDAMKGAEHALKEADHRSQVLQTALGRARSDPKGLAIALASLTPFDQARAKALGVDLAAARNVAREAIPQAIDPVAKRYAAAPTRADADALADLAALAKELGAKLDPATAETVSTAARHIADSGQRLAELRRTAHDWIAGRTRGKPDKALEERVKSVYRIVTGGTGQLYPFDREAATAADDDALKTINIAMLETEGRVVPGTGRRSVAIRIDTNRLSSIDVVAKALPAALAKQLDAAGFTVVSNAGEAVLTLALSDSSVRSLSMDANGRFQRQVLIQADATWRFSGKTMRLGELDGNGADRDQIRALDVAIDATAANIVRSLSAVISQ